MVQLELHAGCRGEQQPPLGSAGPFGHPRPQPSPRVLGQCVGCDDGAGWQDGCWLRHKDLSVSHGVTRPGTRRMR